MANDNAVSVVGNAVRESELRFTPGGMAVCSFGIAVNRRRQDRQTQEWVEETSFFDVVAYGSLAENAAQSVIKGQRVMVQGRLEQRSWETQEGDKRSKVEVIADDIGPSLRWATADVTKNERKSEGSGSSQPRNGSTSKPAARQPARTAPAKNWDDEEEEPFVLDAFEGADRFAPGQHKYRP